MTTLGKVRLGQVRMTILGKDDKARLGKEDNIGFGQYRVG